MDRWLIRTPRPPPELPASPAPSLPPSRHTPAPSRHASSQPTSHPSSSRFPSPQPRHKIEVRIPRPVDEPPKLQPLALLPAHDTTAYIEDKMLLGSAGPAADGNPLPANMGYLVGWTDLPGARIIIPAGDILDFVSPYMLEQFEYAEWEARRHEEREAQAELERLASARRVALETGQEAIPKKKKVGRPFGKRKRGPRKEVEVPVDEGAIQEEVRKRAGSQVREGQPSLSTPKKGLLSGGTESENGAVYRQLYEDTEEETSYPVTSREESRESSEPPRKKLRSSSPVKEGFGGALTGSPTPRARLPLRTPSQFRSETSPTTTGFTPIMAPPPKALQTPKAQGPTSSESRKTSTGPTSTGPKRASKSKKRKTPSKPRTPNPPNGTKAQDQDAEEPEYVVKRLEDMQEITEDGVRERWFSVRWEGTWPEGYNPTWEPEENLPRDMVRKYMAKHPAGSAKKKRKEEPENKEPGMLPRRYSSVMEMFEDSGEEARNDVADSQEDDDGEERFQVTEGAGAGTGAGAGSIGSQGTPSRLLSRAFGFAFGRS